MQHGNSFMSQKKFFARDIYPRGISRSGDFTIKQAALLESCGEAYQALESGERMPINKEEQDFVAVCRGEKAPETEHELVWIRFKEKSSKQHRRAFAGSYLKPCADSHAPSDDWVVTLD